MLTPEFTKTCDVLLSKGTLEAMRARMDLLIAKFMMFRSEDRRRAELPDLFHIPMKDEGVVGDANMLCLQLCQGKVCLYIFQSELIKILDKQGRKATIWCCIS